MWNGISIGKRLVAYVSSLIVLVFSGGNDGRGYGIEAGPERTVDRRAMARRDTRPG